MKTVRLENGVVAEIIPEYALPVKTWYGAEFAAKCVEVPEDVAQGWEYNAETKTFSDPSILSIDELRVAALDRIDGCTSAAIYAGIDITPSTTRGKHHYSFTETAQKDISHMMTNISVGTETSFSYKADDEKLNKYSADEIKEISSALTHLGTVYTKYKEELVTWIGRETSDDILSTIKFGIKLPDDLMKDLTDYIISLGIDPTPYSAMFTV